MKLPAIRRGHILLAGWLLFVIFAYPGYMSTDSVDQLLQARNGPIHDWYPPLMSMLWRQTDRVITGPFPMLVIQSSLFLLGLDALLRRVTTPRIAACAAVSILLLPPVITTMAVIWKDSQMAGFLMAGIACITSRSQRWRSVGIGLLVLGTAQRYNSPAATLPAVGLLFVWREGLSRWKRYAIAVGVWFGITVTAVALNLMFVEKKLYPWHNSVALHDITGTLRFAGHLDDADMRELFDGVPITVQQDFYKHIHKAYLPSNSWLLTHNDGRLFDPPANADQRDAIARTWRTAITSHPIAYLAHRWAVFREVIGIRGELPTEVWDKFTENEAQEYMLTYRATHSTIQQAWLDSLVKLRGTLVFRPRMYLLIALSLLAFTRRKRLPFVILLSGLLHELGLFIAAPAIDYRYSHWMVACTLLATVLLVAMRARSGVHRTSAPDLS